MPSGNNIVGWKDVFIQFVIAAQIKPVKSPDSIHVCGYLKRATVILNKSNKFIHSKTEWTQCLGRSIPSILWSQIISHSPCESSLHPGSKSRNVCLK